MELEVKFWSNEILPKRQSDNEITGEQFRQFYALLMKAEDATEKDEIIRKTKDEKRRTELFRAKSAKLSYGTESLCSTPNGVYHGSIGSDEVFRSTNEQTEWYRKPDWYRWNPNGPKDLNEDEFYQNMGTTNNHARLSVLSPENEDRSLLTPILNVWMDLFKKVTIGL